MDCAEKDIMTGEGRTMEILGKTMGAKRIYLKFTVESGESLEENKIVL